MRLLRVLLAFLLALPTLPAAAQPTPAVRDTLVRALIREALAQPAVAGAFADHARTDRVTAVVRVQARLGWIEDAHATLRSSGVGWLPYAHVAAERHRVGDVEGVLATTRLARTPEDGARALDYLMVLAPGLRDLRVDSVGARLQRVNAVTALSRDLEARGDTAGAIGQLRRALAMARTHPSVGWVADNVLVTLAQRGVEVDPREVVPPDASPSDRASQLFALVHIAEVRFALGDPDGHREILALARAGVPHVPAGLGLESRIDSAEATPRFMAIARSGEEIWAREEAELLRTRGTRLYRHLRLHQVDSFLVAVRDLTPPLPPDSVEMLSERALDYPHSWARGLFVMHDPERSEARRVAVDSVLQWLWDRTTREDHRARIVGEWGRVNAEKARRYETQLTQPAAPDPLPRPNPARLAYERSPAGIDAGLLRMVQEQTSRRAHAEALRTADLIQNPHRRRIALLSIGHALARDGAGEETAAVLWRGIELLGAPRVVDGDESYIVRALDELVDRGGLERVLGWARNQPAGQPRAIALLLTAMALADFYPLQR